ncbi:MAG: helix-turn-helix transcriptional regulator [Proteobacteria bacterium]|nr:helix-turn-helix transcriptional regulator [Pseudomonadota bacterium]
MDEATANTEIFARNLKRICAKTASIAEICRDTGINRQQFNKYLSGKSIPSTRTLRKICERLDITETELFAPFAENHQEDIAQTYQTGRLGREFDRLVKLFMPPDARGVSSGQIPIKPGRYFCYFAFPHHPELILRSFIQVWQRNDMLAFARLTRDRGLSQAPPHCRQGASLWSRDLHSCGIEHGGSQSRATASGKHGQPQHHGYIWHLPGRRVRHARRQWPGRLPCCVAAVV